MHTASKFITQINSVKARFALVILIHLWGEMDRSWQYFKLTARMQKYMISLLVLYVIVIQGPLLSAYRHVPIDEMPLADAAYGISSGVSVVPAGEFWSHIIPVTREYFDAFRPIYLYLLAFIQKLFGLSVISVGLLHAILRLLAVTLVFSIARKASNSVLLSCLIAAVWATFAIGAVGRFEDLAVAFVLLSFWLVLHERKRLIFLAGAGISLGLAFLTYPSYFFMLPMLALIVSANVRLKNIHSFLAVNWRGLTVFIVAVVGTAMLWLFWIIPYWNEFRATFLEFAVPDAVAPSYTASIIDFLTYATGGFLTSPIPYHYSLIPILLLLVLLVYLDVKHNGVSLQSVWALAIPLLIALLTARIRIHKTYNLVWFIMAILLLIPIMWRRVRYFSEGFRTPSKMHRLVIAIIFGLIGIQLFATAALVGLGSVGNIAAMNSCGSAPFDVLIAQIPPDEKVITNSSIVYYEIRVRNPIYWPGGLKGITPGSIPFTSTYDDSFRWLVSTQPLSDNAVDLGGKFGWDTETREYFRDYYELVAMRDLAEECDLFSGLSRYSGMSRSLYLYERTG